ncbi:RE2 [Symbiodinium sp. CCMP2592]|nr:RE2 [Symbiodinium sp. CCMP2592]
MGQGSVGGAFAGSVGGLGASCGVPVASRGRGPLNPEEPAKYINELPKLTQTDLSQSAVVCGNWVAQIRQILVGLSPNASTWWLGVEGPANEAYQKWLVADPLGRLAIDPSMVKGTFDAYAFGRVESRAVSLLLSAVPQGVRAKGVTEESASAASISQTPQPKAAATSSATVQQELLAEAQKLLKGVTLKAARVQDGGDLAIDRAWLLSAMASASDPDFALVDSGATNGLRQAEPGEWERTRAIQVDLASGVAELHIDERGTLLSQAPCQVIVPAGYLIELGYVVSWKKKGCLITHPRDGRLRVQVVKGCPLIPRDDGLRLLREYEGLKDKGNSPQRAAVCRESEIVDPANARAWLCKILRSRGEQGPSIEEQECFLRGMFPELPDNCVRRVVCPVLDPGDVDHSSHPWNRRFRRSVARSKPGGILLHMFANKKSWKGFDRVISLGKDYQSDILSDPVFKYVMSWASSGKIGGLVGSLPRESVWPGGQSSGPQELLRGRYGDRWGFEGLTGEQSRVVCDETVQWFRFFLVFAVAQAVKDAESAPMSCPVAERGEEEVPPPGVEDPKDLALWALRVASKRISAAAIKKDNEGNRSTVFLTFEHPFDFTEGSGIGRTELAGYPSMWAFREVQDLVGVYGLHIASFDQGLLGGRNGELTTIATSSWFLYEGLHGVGIDLKGDPSGELRPCIEYFGWSIGFLARVQGAWLDWCAGKESEAVVAERKVWLAKLSEKELLQQHADNDHVPFLRGCPVCIAAQGRQRSHWRAEVTSLYSLSCDLAGPFKDGMSFDATASGRDKGKGYKYFLSAAYSVPVKPVYLRPTGVEEPRPEGAEDLDYSPSEAEGPEGQASGVSGLDASLIVESGESDLFDASGGLGLKALFRRVREKTFPAVDPLDSSTSFAHQRVAETGPESPGDKGQSSVDGVRVETKTLFLGVPLRSKHGPAVMAQIQALVCRLESAGFPVHRYFSDRAKELRSHDLVRWLRDKGIYASFTAGEDPQGNKAELGVQHLKQGVRKLLQASGLSSSFWPLALLHTSNRNFHELCAALGQPRPAMLNFGAPVEARKRLKSGHKKHWEPRTVPGRYLGQAPDCTGGHLVLVGKNLSDQKVLLTNTIYPLRPEPAPPKPKYRLSGKRSPGFATRAVAAVASLWPSRRPRASRLSPGGESSECSDGVLGFSSEGAGSSLLSLGASTPKDSSRDVELGEWVEVDSDFEAEQAMCLDILDEEDSRGLDVGLKAVAEEQKEWLKELIASGSYSTDEVVRVLRTCAGNLQPANRKIMGGKGRYAILGLYNQGGLNGVTRFALDNQELVRYLNRYVDSFGMGGRYTTLYLSLNTGVPVHRDIRNDMTAPVWIVACGDFQGGGLWIEGEAGQGPVLKVLPNGETRCGWIQDIHDKPFVFEGSRWHCTEPWGGRDRWVIAAYVPRGAGRVIKDHAQQLESLGFNCDGLIPGIGNSGISISKCNQASVSFADDDALSVEGSCVDDEYQTSENDISWEIDFPCEVLEGDWYPNVVQAHAETARLCRVLSQELGGCWDSFCFDGLFGRLRAAENQRDWYEGLLWDEFLRDSAISLRSLSTVPLGSDEPLPASEVFLQTRTVSMTEARRELPLWIPPAQEEVTSLEDVHEAVIRIQVPDIEALVKTGHRVVQVPGKAVLTRKSGVGKRRFRCVACGNFIPQNENAQSLYTTGVEGVTLRVALAYAAHMSWVGRTADIKTAFLNAPLEEGYDNGTEEIVVVRPPHILVEMGLLGVTDRWRVVKALYGLRQAPKAWAVHRDKILKAFEFVYKGSRFVLKQAIADESLWYIIKADISDANNYALMVVYVDDILGLGPRDLLVSLFEAIKNIWTISEPEWIVKEKSVKFCGIELWALDDGFRMSQSDYLRELFARYNISTGASCPMSSWSEPEPEVDATTDLIKEAQGVTGALLWAASKSRPDISYSVCKLGQYATKSPGIVVKAGMQILKYLFDTVELGIEYKRTAGTAWLDTPIPRTVGTVEVFTDASHAPEGARSHQAIMVMWLGSLIAWDSSRQPFTTLSSAESELVAIISGVCAAESVGAILEELVAEDLVVSAMSDNQASIRSFAAGSHGWRNRHLRMRAASCRERIESGSLIVSFVPGERQLADLSTKPLARPRIMYLLNLLSIRARSQDQEVDNHGRVLSRLWLTSQLKPVGSAHMLAGLALLAAIPEVRAQPSGDAALEYYGWFSWLIMWILTGVGLALAWWFVFRNADADNLEEQPLEASQESGVHELAGQGDHGLFGSDAVAGLGSGSLTGGSSSSGDPAGLLHQHAAEALLNQSEPAEPSLDYEDLVQGDEEPVFPLALVGGYLVRHFLVQLLSVEGERVLMFLGDRSESWFRLRLTSTQVRFGAAGSLVEILRQGPWALVFNGPQWLLATEEYIRRGCVDPGFEEPFGASLSNVAQSSHEVPVSGELTEFPYVIWAPSDFVHYLRRLLALNGATLLSLLGNQSVEWVRLRTVSRSFQSGVVLALVVWLQGRGMISRMLDGPVSYDVATAYITGRIAPDSESEDEALDDYPHRDPAYQQHPPVPVFAQMFQEAFEEATSSDASVTSTTEPSVWSASSSEVEELGQVEEVADSLSPSAEAVAGVRYEAEDGKLLVYYVDDVLVVPLPGWSLAQVLVVVQGLRTGVWDNFQEALEAVSGDGAEAPGS